MHKKSKIVIIVVILILVFVYMKSSCTGIFGYGKTHIIYQNKNGQISDKLKCDYKWENNLKYSTEI